MGLRYKVYIGDADNKSYNNVNNDRPYRASVYIEKEECTAHVTKRIGTGLHKIVRTYKR